MIKSYAILGLKSLKERSVRSWLTIFGIIVSIATIMILLTLSSGLQGAVQELFEDFGTNRIFIVANELNVDPGSLGSEQLTQDDVDAVATLSHFEIVIPFVVKNSQLVEYKNEERFIKVSGVPAENVNKIDEAYKFSKNLMVGRFFNEHETKVAILGYNVANDEDTYFSKNVGLKNSIYINEVKFRVVGIYKKLGTDDDNLIYIPLEDAKVVLNIGEDVTAIDAIVKDGVDIENAKEDVERLLKKKKGDEDEFAVFTPEGILKQFNNIIFIVQGLLLAIASISLVVGAIGIANNMFTSIFEREKEIGIMKSVGARNKDVLTMFMIESGLIGLTGGIVGIILGIVVSLLIGFITKALGFSLLSISISIYHVLFLIIFSFTIGMLSGLLPSYLGSRKKIVDTLREH